MVVPGRSRVRTGGTGRPPRNQCQVVLHRDDDDDPQMLGIGGGALRPVVGHLAVAGLVADHRVGQLVGLLGVRVVLGQQRGGDLLRGAPGRGLAEQPDRPAVTGRPHRRHTGVILVTS